MRGRFCSYDDDLVVEKVDGGELVYDGRDHGAHYLDEVAARVRHACAGGASLAAVAASCDRTEAEAEVVLTRLIAIGLVERVGESADAGVSRARGAATDGGCRAG